jgi:hypothetical protein
MKRRIVTVFVGPALALALSGCEAVPTLTFAEAGAAYDASDATADTSPGVDCPATNGGTVPCKGSCDGACDACATQCTQTQLCCATKNGVVCKSVGAACP